MFESATKPVIGEPLPNDVFPEEQSWFCIVDNSGVEFTFWFCCCKDWIVEWCCCICGWFNCNVKFVFK